MATKLYVVVVGNVIPKVFAINDFDEKVNVFGYALVNDKTPVSLFIDTTI